MITKDSQLRILVADDNLIVRNTLCSKLRAQQGWTVCGEATDGRDALQKAIELKPDVILLDVSMPCLNGFEVAARIYQQTPDVEVLLVTEHDSQALALLPSQPGVRGYVVKSWLEYDLIPAVESASKHQPLPNSTAA